MYLTQAWVAEMADGWVGPLGWSVLLFLVTGALYVAIGVLTPFMRAAGGVDDASHVAVDRSCPVRGGPGQPAGG